MKMILKLARTELQSLFFSPIAWLIMIIFTIQASLAFTNVMDSIVNMQELGHSFHNLTQRVFSHPRSGLYTIVQQYLYLYIPLLTMGLMSKEISSGSIKLLYSSPINNTQIIIAKYLSMVFYSLIIAVILFVFTVYGSFTIENFDYPAGIDRNTRIVPSNVRLCSNRTLHVQPYFISGSCCNRNTGSIGSTQYGRRNVARYLSCKRNHILALDQRTLRGIHIRTYMQRRCALLPDRDSPFPFSLNYSPQSNKTKRIYRKYSLKICCCIHVCIHSRIP